MKTLKSLLPLLFCLLSSQSQGQVSPSIEWKVLKGPHFDLVYDAKQQELALPYLLRLEKARAMLATLWPELPERLSVIINDRTDLTNGYATALPYAHIMIFPVLPGPLEGISELEDWAQDVLTHELAHILTFEHRRGGVRFLSWFFGRIITPNALLPRWWHEGLAVNSETLFSNQGRLRSRYQDASLRALAATPDWMNISLAEINESTIPTFPYGGRPYLYGSLLWSEMIALHGAKSLVEMNEAMGGRVPYFLNGPTGDLMEGKDLATLWEQSKAETQKRVLKQKEILESSQLSSLNPLADAALVESMNPAISPDGTKLAFIGKDDSLKRSIQVLARASTQVPFEAKQRIKTFGEKSEANSPLGGEIKIPRIEDGPPGGSINRISWRSDSKTFVFDRLAEVDQFNDSSDLWIYSFEKSKASQLTHNLRAREPAYSPNSELIAFVKIEAGRTLLGILDPKTGKARVVYRPELFARVTWPVWLDNESLLFTVRSKGHETFWKLSLKDKNAQALALPYKNPTLPVVKNGKIYFVSDESGVRNLYRSDFDFKKTESLSHLWTGAWAFDIDSHQNRIWVTTIRSSGFSMDQMSLAVRNTNPPTLSGLYADRYPAQTSIQPESLDLKTETQDYSAIPYLWPRYWLPFVYWDDKGTQTSVSTAGFDPLKKHGYSIFGSYNSAVKRGSYQVQYLNHTLTPQIVLSGSDSTSYLADPSQESRYQNASAISTWQLPRISPDLFASIGAITLSREQFGIRSNQSGMVGSILYSSLSQSGNEISPESGGSAGLSLMRFGEQPTQKAFTQTQGSLTWFGKWPWLKHQAWMIRSTAQHIDSDILISNYNSSFSTTTGLAPGTHAYLMRGYVTGAFLGKSILNSSLEYRFPVSRIDIGGDSAPWYLHRLSGAVVSDFIWMEGYLYDVENKLYRRVSNWTGYGSYGIEFKLELTLGYHFPIQIISGLHSPIENEFTQSSPRFSLGIGL